MIDLGQMRHHPVVAPHVRWVDDLSELYCRTKAAQAQAEQCGFEGMAAALADIAATLAWEPGVDLMVVRALAEHGPAGRTSASASVKPHGERITRH